MSTPSLKFASLGIAQVVSDHLPKLGITEPTEIQSKVIPLLVSNQQDVVIQEKTGAGKTLSYCLPIITHLLNFDPHLRSRKTGTLALVIVPTRELVQQVYKVLLDVLKFRGSHWLVPGMLCGGENKNSEKSRLRKGINVLVTTPGRLLDHLKTTSCFKRDGLRFLVLDEADRLLDMGFEKDLREIIFQLDVCGCRKILCSATASPDLIDMLELQDPLFVSTNSAANKITQQCIYVDQRTRFLVLVALLKRILKTTSKPKIVIFFSCCASVDFHFQLLSHFPNTNPDNEMISKSSLLNQMLFRLHGNHAQADRLKVYDKFMNSQGILLSTDVSARGLDMPNVTHIIQFDVPSDYSDYIHRIGRTARIGASGSAVLFLMDHEKPYAELLEKDGHTLVTLNTKKMLSKHLECDDRRLNRRSDEEITQITKFVDQNLKQLAKDAFLSTVRAYTTHPSRMKHIFHVKKLHLGHLAKSFGLLAAPNELAKHENVKEPKKSVKRKLVSEFDSAPFISKKKK